MKIAVICEYSGRVRDAFIRRGHDAISFDLLDTESPGPHEIGDVTLKPQEYWEQFDIIICHPPCTHLAVSGARWFKGKVLEQAKALSFVRWCFNLPVRKLCVENPVSIISSHFGKPQQIIQPWQFGHGETKTTCLWLIGLPLLKPTNIVEGREQRIHLMPPGPDRWKERSRTYQGIANAMADQWG